MRGRAIVYQAALLNSKSPGAASSRDTAKQAVAQAYTSPSFFRPVSHPFAPSSCYINQGHRKTLGCTLNKHRQAIYAVFPTVFPLVPQSLEVNLRFLYSCLWNYLLSSSFSGASKEMTSSIFFFVKQCK